MNTTKKSMWPLLLFIVSSLWLSTHTLARDLGTRECVMWFPWLEWSLENETWEGNPFELGTRVTFQHIATGRAIGTDMFYDGNSTWKFRFAGTMEGMWKLVTVSEDPELNGHTGTINVKKNPNKSARGFMVNNNQKWAWIGTNKIVAPQFVMYKSLDKIAQDPEALDRDIDLFLNGHGFSGFHLPSVSMGWFDLELAGKGSDSMNDDNPNPDLETFTVLEDLIGRVYQAGGSVHIWLWGDESRKQTPVAWGINQKVDHRFQQYFTARLGMLPGWSVGYGYDLFEWTTLNQLQSWYSYMHRHLPYSVS